MVYSSGRLPEPWEDPQDGSPQGSIIYKIGVLASSIGGSAFWILPGTWEGRILLRLWGPRMPECSSFVRLWDLLSLGRAVSVHGGPAPRDSWTETLAGLDLRAL